MSFNRAAHEALIVYLARPLTPTANESPLSVIDARGPFIITTPPRVAFTWEGREKRGKNKT